MPATLPDGDPAPADGALPDVALADLGRRGHSAFGIYVHVPFCSVRCGYCDFNTYTAGELGATPGASRSSYAEAAVSELRLARRVLGDRDLPVSTVFFGGGTPTLLPPGDLHTVLSAVGDMFGLTTDVEVTTESNPDSVDAADVASLRAGGINRISFGMQSAVPAVLAVLDRTHDPSRVPRVVEWARAAGFDQVSLDLIYGTPGESVDDWRTSLDAAVAMAPDHLSAYALVVEPGTALGRRVSRGEIERPDDDDLADKYELADDVLTAAGLGWYEVSNWARDGAARCRHNLGYWEGSDWWGIGPGAHSHVGGVRWWNVKHPAAYADRVAAGVSPAAAREVLDDETRRVERVLLETRLVTGLPLGVLDPPGRSAVAGLVDDGLVLVRLAGVPTTPGVRPTTPGIGPTSPSAAPGKVVTLTRRGRLLADAVVRALLP